MLASGSGRWERFLEEKTHSEVPRRGPPTAPQLAPGLTEERPLLAWTSWVREAQDSAYSVLKSKDKSLPSLSAFFPLMRLPVIEHQAFYSAAIKIRTQSLQISIIIYK